jgi:histidine ammonia-lyase
MAGDERRQGEGDAVDRVLIGDAPLTIDAVVAVARGRAEVRLGDAARARIARAHQVIVDVVARGDVVYGVTTGFGQLATTHIPLDKVRELQENLVRSHAAGVGVPLSREVVRAAMTVRLNTLARGYSGVRVEVAELLAAMLNADLVPWVPSRGSLGASGDLAPSAHLVLAMMGEGELLGVDGAREPAGPALQAAGLAPVTLQAKEGLSLLNGTQFMTAIGCFAVVDGESLLDSADLIGAMSMEGLRASVGPFEERIQLLRPIPGQIHTAENVRAATVGSEIMLSHLNCDKVQDAYSIRCIPQVHGACRDALRWLREVITVEVDAVTDNPLVFPDTGEIISAGNFHGEPLALALDLAAMSLSEIASISERRVFRMLTSSLSELPPFLTNDSGLNSGYMIGQYVAAALVAENKVLCHPASVDSIPSSADQEDHVSLGMTAALKFQDVLRNAQTVLGIEALCAAQAIDLLAPLKPGSGTSAGYTIVRRLAPMLGRDRSLSPEIEAAARVVAAGEFAAVVRARH